jgi:hypothetical protein
MDPPQRDRTGDLTDALRAVHEAYISKVNAAVAMDRLDLVTELTDAYVADAQRMITQPS